MAFYKSIQIKSNITVHLWKITEDFNTLFRQVQLKDSSLARLEAMKSESHQKGFLAVRMLLQHLGYNDYDLYYDPFGKPHLKNKEKSSNKEFYISISHSLDFSAIVISDKLVGLDLEQLKEKTVKIAPRFMDVAHLENLSEEEKIKKATVVWGIKESIFKIKNEKGISFPNHIFEDDFSLQDKEATAKLKFNNKEEKYKIRYDSIEDYIFVCAFEERK
jgi:phosphopantetheinyl transferase